MPGLIQSLLMKILLSLNLQIQSLEQPVQVKALDNHVIHSFSTQTNPIHVSLDNHHEDIQSHIKSPQLPWVLGATWLKKHNPYID